MQARILVLGFMLVTTVSGCGKVAFGNGCDKAVDLVSPWTDMALPLEDGKARVCEASTEALKLRSYTWKSKEEAGPALEQAMVAAGWAKDRCTAQACYYDKDGFEVSVQPMDFEVKDKKLVTIAMHHKADARQARAKDKAGTKVAAAGGDADGGTAKAAPAATGGAMGVAECDDYVAKVEACTTFNRSAKPYTSMIDAWKKKIDAGEGDAVAGACTKAAQLFKCPAA
jgi:hypothetical protein